MVQAHLEIGRLKGQGYLEWKQLLQKVSKEFIGLTLWKWLLQFVNNKIEDLKFFGAEVFNLGRLSEMTEPNIKKEIKVDLEDGDNLQWRFCQE